MLRTPLSLFFTSLALTAVVFTVGLLAGWSDGALGSALMLIIALMTVLYVERASRAGPR